MTALRPLARATLAGVALAILTLDPDNTSFWQFVVVGVLYGAFGLVAFSEDD